MSNFTEKVSNFIKRNDTNIMTGIGIANGLGLGTYLWYRTGQKYEKKIAAEEAQAMRKLTFKEKCKKSWKLFIFPTINTIASGALLIYSAKVGNKRLAALSAAYNLTEVAFQQYIDKTKETLGEKKAEKIAQEVSNGSVQGNANNLVVVTGDGDSLFYEPLTDRYFQSNWTKIQKAANELNASALSGFDGRITLPDWFDKLG